MPNVTLAYLATSPSNVTLPAQSTFLVPRPTRPSRSALRGGGTVVTLRVGPFLASPSGLRFSLSLRSLP